MPLKLPYQTFTTNVCNTSKKSLRFAFVTMFFLCYWIGSSAQSTTTPPDSINCIEPAKQDSTAPNGISLADSIYNLVNALTFPPNIDTSAVNIKKFESRFIIDGNATQILIKDNNKPSVSKQDSTSYYIFDNKLKIYIPGEDPVYFQVNYILDNYTFKNFQINGLPCDSMSVQSVSSARISIAAITLPVPITDSTKLKTERKRKKKKPARNVVVVLKRYPGMAYISFTNQSDFPIELTMRAKRYQTK